MKPLRRTVAATFSVAIIAALFTLPGCGTHHPTPIATTPPPQNLTTLANQPPDGSELGFLLTDGTILFQGNSLSDWYKLTPDQTGSYLNGTWSQAASLPAGYAPSDFSSQVLATGQLVVLGGEYNNGNFLLSNLGAIFDPVANTWTSLAAPTGWDYIGDSPSVVLPSGDFLIGDKLNTLMAEFDPASLQWSAESSTGKSDENAEEGWTLLPDGSVLAIDVTNAPNSERYIPSMQTWISAGSTPEDLHSPGGGNCRSYGGGCYVPAGEIGPAILLPDGTVFATGASTTGAAPTAVYTPPTVLTDAGSWTAGPDFPNSDSAGDSFAVLLTSGHVLVEAVSGKLYEFDGQTLTEEANVAPQSSLLVLPTGEVIVGGNIVQIYTSSGTPSAAWAPVIRIFPLNLPRGSTQVITGTQFNGLSQAAGYGDEDQTATNYPLVRITNQATGHVFYAHTHDHSTMAVATGSALVSTNFDVPTTMETGQSSLEVVANGIASASVTVNVN
jgi:hypothetical protein